MKSKLAVGIMVIALVLILVSSSSLIVFASNGSNGSHGNDGNHGNHGNHGHHTTTTQTESENGDSQNPYTNPQTTTTEAVDDEGVSQTSVSTSSTSTTTTTTTSMTSTPNREYHELVYRMTGTNGGSAQGQGNIQIKGTNLKVDVEIEHASPLTEYTLALIAIPSSSGGGTSFGTSSMGGTDMGTGVGTSTTSQDVCGGAIGQLMTSKVGQGIAHLYTSLGAGTYQIGIVLCVGDTPAIMSVPTTQEGILTSGQGSSDSSAVQQDAVPVTPIAINAHEEALIQSAEQNGQIVANLGGGFGHSAQLSGVNSEVSTAVGSFGSSGLIVSLSSVTSQGSGVILVNLGHVPISNMLKAMAVTFNGVAVAQASSVNQVLSSAAGQSSYVLLQGASGLELLMSVPQFTNDVVQILPVVSYSWVFISAIAGLVSAAVIGTVALVYRENFLAIPWLH